MRQDVVQQPARRNRKTWVLLALLAAACPLLVHKYGKVACATWMGSYWNSEAKVLLAKHWMDTTSVTLIVICSVLYILLHSKVWSLAENRRTILEITNVSIAAITALTTISLSSIFSDRAADLGPLHGITSRYNPDGSQTHNLFGLELVEPTREVQVFRQIIELQNTGQWEKLSQLCSKQITKTPDWLTPYVARAAAQASLGNIEPALGDCEFVSRQPQTDSIYAQATNLLAALNAVRVAQKHYSGLSWQNLQNEALLLIADLREFQQRFDSSGRAVWEGDRAQEMEFYARVYTNQSAFQTNRELVAKFLASRFEAQGQESLVLSSKYAEEYSRRFWSSAWALQRDLFARFPKATRPEARTDFFTTQPNHFTYSQVPDLLEKMVRTLPTGGLRPYANWSNQRIKKESAELAQAIRRLAEGDLPPPDRATGSAATPWMVKNDERATRDQVAFKEYTARFRVTAVLVRDELISRFPKESCPNIFMSSFDNPLSTMSMRTVAAGLETLGTALPDR